MNDSIFGWWHLLIFMFQLIILGAKCDYFSGGVMLSSQNLVLTLLTDSDSGMVSISMNGPAGLWFGFGFGGNSMCGTYAIVASGADTVEERKLGCPHGAGASLSPSIDILEDHTVNDRRRVLLQRDRVGVTSNYFTFPEAELDIDIILAYGGTTTFGQHTYRNVSVLSVSRTETTTPSPTAPPYDLCRVTGNKYQTCAYLIQITFNLLYSFTDDSNVNADELTAIIETTASEILATYISNTRNIESAVTITAQQSGEMEIISDIGIQNDTVYSNVQSAYNNEEIENRLSSSLPSNIANSFPSSGFAITEDSITSEFTLVAGTPLSTAYHPSSTASSNADDDDWSALFGFIEFDFVTYSLYDWIVLGGLVALVLLLCFCCCCWYSKRRRNKKLPHSNLSVATGQTRVSVFEKQKSNASRPKVQIALTYENQVEMAETAEAGAEEKVVLPQYTATPLQTQFSEALNKAAAKHLVTAADEEDEEENHSLFGPQTFGTGASMALAGGNVSAREEQHFAVQAAEEQLVEDDEDYYYDDEENPYVHAGLGGGRGARGQVPPPVRASMVDAAQSAIYD